ncbi:MAG: hypothetical protein AAFQ42_02105 [Pseudomonadota bacterium]
MDLLFMRWTFTGPYRLASGACTSKTWVGEGAGFAIMGAWEEGWLYGFKDLSLSPAGVVTNYNYASSTNWSFCVKPRSYEKRQVKDLKSLNSCSSSAATLKTRCGVELDLRQNNRSRMIAIL